MTVSAQTPINRSTGNGVTTVFPYTFKIISAADIEVTVDDVLQTLNVDYTVSGAGVDAGGNVTMTTAPANLTTVVRRRNMALVRTTDYQDQGTLPAATLDLDIDATVLMVQQLDERLDRTFSLPASFSGDSTLPAPAPGYLLGWDATGENLTNIAAQTGTSLVDLSASGGSALVGFIQSGTGAVATTVQIRLRNEVWLTDFDGYDKTGVTGSDTAFAAAKTHLATLGGGTCHVPFGDYMLTDFVLDENNIVFEGETPGYGYDEKDFSVNIIPGPSAVFAVRLKGTRSGVVVNASAGSGFKNIKFLEASAGSTEYGVFIDSGATVMEEVVVQGFEYGCVIADQANANRFKNCNFILNTKVGFAVTEHQGKAYLHPNITDISAVSNTTFLMEGCNIRQNGFGMVLRSLVGASFKDSVIESNDQAGLYVYRTDVSTVRALKFDNVWLENNYEDYTSGSTSYSITGNNMLKITDASTYIAWTSAYQAGYQIVIDSQTHYGGGADNFVFNVCQINCAGVQQKALHILAGFKFDFYKPWFTGGDTANLVAIRADAEAVHWHDPIAGNNPYALVTSITDSFGANSGSRGAYYKSGTRFGTAELGGVYPIVGVTGGPVHFLAPVTSDPRRADVRCLDDYLEDNSYPVGWRVGSALPFTVNTQSNSLTKIGRQVHVEMVATLTANATTAATDKLYSGQWLTVPAAAAGNLVGRAWVQATGGGASVVNGGICDMWMDTTTSLLGVVDVFPILAIGHTYTIKVCATYTAET